MPSHRRRQRTAVSNRSAGVHVLDLALIYAELERMPGVTQADIARKYQKSAGYVSVLCRLGQSVRSLPPEAREALRVPRITFKAAQAAVSRYPAPADRAALLAALQELAAGRPATRSRQRSMTGGTAAWREPVPYGSHEDPIDPVPLPPSLAKPPAEAYVFRWNAEAVARDPGGVLEDYERFVRETTADVVMRLRRALDGRLDGGAVTPTRSVPATDRTAPGSAPTPDAPATPSLAREPVAKPATILDADLSLRQLTARIDAQLKAHRERMAEFLAERERARSRRSTTTPPAAGVPPTPSARPEFTAAELEADLE